jgi:ABC-type Mn2+/Zn2+ transport system ATPase subunit
VNHELVRLAGVDATYGDGLVLEGIDLTINGSDFLGIVGPSGSGKSTLLRAIAGAHRPYRGTIDHAKGLTIGYVPQVETVNWYFPVTVREVLLMAAPGARVRATPAERARADDLLAQLGLDGLAGRHIRALSGGQQQRVFIARAMMRAPQLLLLDEPTSGVDVATRHDVLHLLHELHHDGYAIVVTTHDLNGIAAHLPRIACLNRSLIAVGDASQVLTPAILEATYGAPMEVLLHGGMPVVVEKPPDLRPIELHVGDHHEHDEDPITVPEERSR